MLERAARLVADRAETFARTICLEAGKPMKQARGEAARCVDTLTFSAVEARSLAGEVVPMESSAAGAGKLGIILREPVGVVGAISPFNFPLNLVAHKLAPAIAAGCPVVLKPASSTPLSALLLAHTLTEAGLPDGFLSVVIGGGGSVGNAIVDHPDVPMISFTGSPPVGWGIRQRQPRKHVALELGNSTPVIVEPDADLEVAAQKLAASGYTHAGQSCISVQRVYVHEAAFDRFRDLFVGAVEGLVVGDPMDDATDVGPVIDEESRDRILEWIGEARQAGAEVLAGGGLNEDGLIAPTVIEGIDPEMKVSCEEVFGPVVGLASYASIDEAIDLANSSPFGPPGGHLHRPHRRRHGLGRPAALRRRGDQRDAHLPRRPDALRRRQGQRQHPRGAALRGAQHERAEARAAEHPAGLAAGGRGRGRVAALRPRPQARGARRGRMPASSSAAATRASWRSAARSPIGSGVYSSSVP